MFISTLDKQSYFNELGKAVKQQKMTLDNFCKN